MIEPRWRGDYRDVARFAHLRTACHGCRKTAHAHVTAEDGVARLRPMLMVGDGTVLREVAPGHLAIEPCPMCADGSESGWLRGFRPPV